MSVTATMWRTHETAPNRHKTASETPPSKDKPSEHRCIGAVGAETLELDSSSCRRVSPKAAAASLGLVHHWQIKIIVRKAIDSNSKRVLALESIICIFCDSLKRPALLI